MTEPRDIKERTFYFATRIVALCRDLKDSDPTSGTLAPQLLRSGTAIGLYVDEAHGNHHKPDFIAKMSLAAKEARETNYWLRLLTDTEDLSPTRLAELTDEATQLLAILTTIVKRSRENPV